MSADLVLKDGGTIIYTSPSPGVSTAIGDFPGFALMDLMKPYMPPTAENYQRVLHDIHKREIQMWAGCIWVPIYEVMTRKHLTVVTLEENLELAADIGLDATTSLDDAFAAAMERHGPMRRSRCSRTPATSCRRTPSGCTLRTRRRSRLPGLAEAFLPPGRTVCHRSSAGICRLVRVHLESPAQRGGTCEHHDRRRCHRRRRTVARGSTAGHRSGVCCL